MLLLRLSFQHWKTKEHIYLASHVDGWWVCGSELCGTDPGWRCHHELLLVTKTRFLHQQSRSGDRTCVNVGGAWSQTHSCLAVKRLYFQRRAQVLELQFGFPFHCLSPGCTPRTSQAITSSSAMFRVYKGDSRWEGATCTAILSRQQL